MFVCVCVYVYVCLCGCLYVFIYIENCKNVSVSVCIYTYIYILRIANTLSLCVYVFTSLSVSRVYKYTHCNISVYLSLCCWPTRTFSDSFLFLQLVFSLAPSVSFLIQLCRLPITTDTLISPVFPLLGGCLYRPFRVISLVSFSISHQMHFNLSSFTESPMNSPWMYPSLALFLIHHLLSFFL